MTQTNEDTAHEPMAVLARRIPLLLARFPDRSVQGLRGLRRGQSRELRARSGRDLLALAEQLLHVGCTRWFVYELIHHHPAAMASLTARKLQHLGRDLASWGEVDPFGCYVLGPAWREGRISDAASHRGQSRRIAGSDGQRSSRQ